MYEFTLVCAVALEGHDSLNVATSLMNVGNVLFAMGKYEEALVQHQKSLDIKIRMVGTGGDHPFVAASYCNMGVLLEKTGKYEEALEMHTKALEIDIRVHGDSHLLVADTWNKMMMPLFVLTETINSLPL